MWGSVFNVSVRSCDGASIHGCIRAYINCACMHRGTRMIRPKMCSSHWAESSESAIGVGRPTWAESSVSASCLGELQYMGRIVRHYMRLIILCGVYIYYVIIS